VPLRARHGSAPALRAQVRIRGDGCHAPLHQNDPEHHKVRQGNHSNGHFRAECFEANWTLVLDLTLKRASGYPESRFVLFGLLAANPKREPGRQFPPQNGQVKIAQRSIFLYFFHDKF